MCAALGRDFGETLDTIAAEVKRRAPVSLDERRRAVREAGKTRAREVAKRRKGAAGEPQIEPGEA